MTIADPNTGTIGGMPAANIMYGPANASFMGYQAQQQNMNQAQATTRSTDAQTNRTNLLAPYEAQGMAATARNTNAIATNQEFNNKVQDEFGVGKTVEEKQASLEKMQMDNNSQRRQQEERVLMTLGPALDGKTADGQDKMIADEFARRGLKTDNASSWGNIVRSHEPSPPPGAGPANASSPRGGGSQTASTLLQINNPSLIQAGMEIEGRKAINTQTTETEKAIAKNKIDQEDRKMQLDAQLDPAKASQYYEAQYYDSLKTGNTAAANEYRMRSLDAYYRAGNLAAMLSFGRNANNIDLNKIMGKDVTVGGAGHPSGPATVGPAPAGAPPVPPGATGGGSATPLPAPLSSSAPAAPSGRTVTVVAPDGRTGTIPAENLQKALAAGYKQAS